MIFVHRDFTNLFMKGTDLSPLRKTMALAMGSLATALIHLLFEALATLIFGPPLEICPLLINFTSQNISTFFAVFIIQGFLIGLAFFLIEPAFSSLSWLKKGILFGFVLWILSAVLPLLPLCFLYRIGLRASDAVSGLVSGFILSELMGVGFVGVYYSMCRGQCGNRFYERGNI